ncbi:MAG: methylglyoxal synthase [Actinomycetota bacterium]
MGIVRQIGRRTPFHPSAQRPVITVALIAHDAKKDELARFMRAHAGFTHAFRFLAPEDTAAAVDDPGLDLEVTAPDTLGGDLQIAAAIVEGRVDAVIFFHDPLAALPSEPALMTTLKVCDLEPIPVATNRVAAEILLHHLSQIADREPGAAQGLDDVVVERVLMLAAPRPGEDGPPPQR